MRLNGTVWHRLDTVWAPLFKHKINKALDKEYYKFHLFPTEEQKMICCCYLVQEAYKEIALSDGKRLCDEFDITSITSNIVEKDGHFIVKVKVQLQSKEHKRVNATVAHWWRSSMLPS